MNASFDKVLEWLKPLNDSGLINALGVIATFAAVFVALLPTFWKWKKRPKLSVLLKAIEIKNTIGGVQVQPVQPAISTTARMLVKNVGGSAALNVRAVITDFYVQSSSKPLSFVWSDYGDKTLSPSDKDLPVGLSFGVSLVGRLRMNQFDTGFILGGVPPATSINIVGKMVRVDDPPLSPGTYVIHVVVPANNAVPTTHLIRMQLLKQSNRVLQNGWNNGPFRKLIGRHPEVRLAPADNKLHVYELRPRKDKRGVDPISDVPFTRCCHPRL
jgi:hypothetical protein